MAFGGIPSSNPAYIDHARELICPLDPQAKLLTMNAACEEILALPPRQMLSRSFFDLHPPEEHQPIEKAFAVARSGMKPETFRARCRRGDATFATMDWSVQWSPHYEIMFCVGRVA